MEEFNIPHGETLPKFFHCNLILTLPREASSAIFFRSLIKFTRLNYSRSLERDNLVSYLFYNYIVLDILGN